MKMNSDEQSLLIKFLQGFPKITQFLNLELRLLTLFPISLILESSSSIFFVTFLLVIMDTLDLASFSSLLAKRIDAILTGFLLGEVVWRVLLKWYYCLDDEI